MIYTVLLSTPPEFPFIFIMDNGQEAKRQRNPTASPVFPSSTHTSQSFKLLLFQVSVISLLFLLCSPGLSWLLQATRQPLVAIAVVTYRVNRMKQQAEQKDSESARLAGGIELRECFLGPKASKFRVFSWFAE